MRQGCARERRPRKASRHLRGSRPSVVPARDAALLQHSVHDKTRHKRTTTAAATERGTRWDAASRQAQRHSHLAADTRYSRAHPTRLNASIFSGGCSLWGSPLPTGASPRLHPPPPSSLQVSQTSCPCDLARASTRRSVGSSHAARVVRAMHRAPRLQTERRDACHPSSRCAHERGRATRRSPLSTLCSRAQPSRTTALAQSHPRRAARSECVSSAQGQVSGGVRVETQRNLACEYFSRTACRELDSALRKTACSSATQAVRSSAL